MVVVPDETPEGLRQSRRAYEALWGLKVSADVLVWTHSAFEDRLHLRASLPAAIIREGRLLHADGRTGGRTDRRTGGRSDSSATSAH